MPCLNEAASVGICVRKARSGLAKAGLSGEVVVVDNGSTDGSAAAATAAGARVVHESRRGYGNAYLAGFAAARGRIIVMGDADDTYDFAELGRLIGPLRAGRADYVLGSRFAGKILPGAMPWLHRYVGNPVLTGILNRLFGVRSSDAHSGMRAFTRDAYHRMGLRCEGMELASELVIAAARAGLQIEEVPITYHPRVGASKLHSLRDGWRHLRFMLLLAPRHLFVLPGAALLAAGLLGQLALLTFVAGTGAYPLRLQVLCALTAVVGWQAVLLGMFADAQNHATGWGGPDRWPMTALQRLLSLERGLLVGAALVALGLVPDILVGVERVDTSLGTLGGLRPSILGLTLAALGAQTAFASFFLRLLTVGPSGGHSRAPWPPVASPAGGEAHQATPDAHRRSGHPAPGPAGGHSDPPALPTSTHPAAQPAPHRAEVVGGR
jgi:hypothetical protein